MTVHELLKYCLSLPEAYLYHPFGPESTCVGVRGKLFAELFTAADSFKITLKCDAALAQRLRREYPGTVCAGYHCAQMQKAYWNTVYPNRGVQDKELLRMVSHSYHQVVGTMPKRVQRELRLPSSEHSFKMA